MQFKENRPLYLQIADRMCADIVRGIYSADGRVPSVRDVAAEVQVNANTVVKTYDYLQQREIIYNKRGLGYFVSANAAQIISQGRKETFVKETLPELFAEMHTLGITIDEITTLFGEYQKNNNTITE